jgi:hypothetical protein
MASLTRCTAAKEHADRSGRAVPKGPPRRYLGRRRRKRRPVFAWSGTLRGYLGLRPNRPGDRSASARTPDPNWRAMIFAAAAAVLCCCTRPWNHGLGLSNWDSDLEWSYGDSNPRPLACHTVQHVHPRPSVQVTVSGRPHESSGIQAGCFTFVLYSPSRPQKSRDVAVLHALSSGDPVFRSA